MNFLKSIIAFFRWFIEGFNYPDIEDVDPHSEDVE